jgi:sulfate adenylyltransferase
MQPVVGLVKPGDVDAYMRVRGYQTFLEKYQKSRMVLNLLPLATRMAGPREAVWRSIIGRNYGANHFILACNDGVSGRNAQDKLLCEECEKLLEHVAPEIAMKLTYITGNASVPDDEFLAKENLVQVGPFETEACTEDIGNAANLPNSPQPSLVDAPVKSRLSGHQQGFCIWLTGLSGAGKSTLAETLTVLLMEHGRAVTLLDGDVVRTHLSKGLGFSKEDRDTNVLRIGFVASEIVRHHGVVVCAAVSPYRAARSQCRHMIGDKRFIEIFVDAPLEVRERRDTKGMYAQARREEVKGFSGISDSYEQPLDPEIHLITMYHSPEEDARRIITYLIDRGFLRDK